MLLALGRAYFQTRAARKSIHTYDSALLASPPLRRPALAHIGRARAYHALKDGKRARAALGKALQLEPKNKEALGLKKKLKWKTRSPRSR